MFANTPGPFPWQDQQGEDYSDGDRLVERIMAAEYNLAVQRNDGPQAMGILARMLGQWLQTRSGR